jgi:hypothetical protein
MIEGREERDPGYDDWFDEPEPLTETQGNAARGVYDDVEEVWVLPEDDRPRTRVRREIVIGGRTLTTAQAAIIVASAVAVLLAVLAAAGVFSPSKAATPPVTNPTPPPTVTPPTSTPATPAQTAQAPDQTLSPGATGAQVKILQRALNALGYPVGKPDGDYGPVTQTAVEKFQVAKNLPEDGVVGPQTLAALRQALSG